MWEPLLPQQQFSILQKAVVVESNGGILAAFEGIFAFIEGKGYANGVLRSQAAVTAMQGYPTRTPQCISCSRQPSPRRREPLFYGKKVYFLLT